MMMRKSNIYIYIHEKTDVWGENTLHLKCWLMSHSTNGVVNVRGVRVADVARAREQRSPKGQGLLQKERPPTYAILSQNLVLLKLI